MVTTNLEVETGAAAELPAFIGRVDTDADVEDVTDGDEDEDRRGFERPEEVAAGWLNSERCGVLPNAGDDGRGGFVCDAMGDERGVNAHGRDIVARFCEALIALARLEGCESEEGVGDGSGDSAHKDVENGFRIDELRQIE